MAVNLAGTDTLNRARLPVEVQPNRPVQPPPETRPEDRIREREAQAPRPAPPEFLTAPERVQVQDRFEPLSPVLQRALENLREVGRELQSFRIPSPTLEGSEPPLRAPRGNAVAGGLPVTLPGQSQPTTPPASPIEENRSGSSRVEAEGTGVARAPQGERPLDTLQRILRGAEPRHLAQEAREAERVILNQAPISLSPQGPSGASFDPVLKGVVENAFPVQTARTETVAEPSVRRDNDRVSVPGAVDRGVPESVGNSGGVTIGFEEGGEEAPPLSNVNRFEPPLPTNARSRLIGVATINLLDLVL